MSPIHRLSFSRFSCVGKRQIHHALPAGILELLDLGNLSSYGFTTFGTYICTEYHELSPIFFKDSFHKLESEMTQSVLIKKVSEMVKTIEIKNK